MVFFRGGWAGLVNNRGNEIFTDVEETFGTGSSNNKNSGYYVGAGLDMVMTKDLWGMFPGIWALGEIGVEFKRWNSKKVAQAVPSTAGVALGTQGIQTKKVKLTMLTVSISPKIMFMEKSRFRPWIIPIGLDFHVISPPSYSQPFLILVCSLLWAHNIEFGKPSISVLMAVFISLMAKRIQLIILAQSVAISALSFNHCEMNCKTRFFVIV